MKIARSVLALALLTTAALGQETATSQSTTQPVSRGEVLKFSYTAAVGSVFTGTAREVWVYVPREYDPAKLAKGACLLVDQDGVQFHGPAVFDRLIAEGSMPVTIGVFVAPGKIAAASANALPRFNRSYEFDGMSGEYAKFLLTEILPWVETKTASDGRAIHLSKDPNDRAIIGSSSGAIAAFTAAWERPESFHRVFTSIGTFVDLRGGNVYPSLIRKFEPKPLRVFLQDGSNDHNHYGGDWWMANQEMERALTFAGYEVNHVYGTGGHDHVQADEIFPEAMKWLWKDWPAEVKVGAGSEQLQQVLIPGEGWTVVRAGLHSTDGPNANEKGEVIFNDGVQTYAIDAGGAVRENIKGDAKKNGAAFGPDGRWYTTAGDKLIAYDVGGAASTIAEDVRGNDLVIGHNGDIYLTESVTKPAEVHRLWLFKHKADGTYDKILADAGLKDPDGVTLSPDQTLLYLNDYRSHWVYSFTVLPDGTLANKQRFYDLYVRDADDDAGADGMRVDRDGRLWVSTRAGIQVCDQAGRVVAIVPTPNGRVSNLCFGGAKFDVLYATCGDKVFGRRLKVQGANAWDVAIKPAPPKL
jgi:gluconolactonase